MRSELQTKVFCVFPGVGKTYTVENCKEFSILDSDSSNYHFEEGLGGSTIKADWPLNYIGAIRNAIESEKYDFIFVSSHIEIRELLNTYDIQYQLIMPHIEEKANYIERYKQRGNSEKFISLINDNWFNWLEHQLPHETDEKCKKYFINGYLSDWLLFTKECGIFQKRPQKVFLANS